MDITQIRNYCLQFKGVSECFPFDENVLVFKVLDKMFALMNLNTIPLQVNLKCNPEKSELYREQYHCIVPGYHMNKKHWNTVELTGELSSVFLKELIQHSYQLVVEGMSKKNQESLKD